MKKILAVTSFVLALLALVLMFFSGAQSENSEISTNSEESSVDYSLPQHFSVVVAEPDPDIELSEQVRVGFYLDHHGSPYLVITDDFSTQMWSVDEMAQGIYFPSNPREVQVLTHRDEALESYCNAWPARVYDISDHVVFKAVARGRYFGFYCDTAKKTLAISVEWDIGN